MDDDRASTMTVLMDISAERRKTDERLDALGESAAKPSDLPDGLKPYLLPHAAQAVAAIWVQPNWANTLYAAAIGAIATDPEKEDVDLLRKYLVQVASTAVAWIEVLDERKSFK